MINWKNNSKRPLFFSHVVMNYTLGAHKARDIRARINLPLDLWERGIHTGMVGDY